MIKKAAAVARLSTCHRQLLAEIAENGLTQGEPLRGWAARARSLLTGSFEVDGGIAVARDDDSFRSCCLVWSVEQPLDFGSGVFVGGKIVVTAAHVVAENTPYAASMPCVDWVDREVSDARVVDVVYRQDDPGSGGQSDLAILVLEREPEVNEFPRLGTLADFQLAVRDAANNTICGFGADGDDVPRAAADRRGIKRQAVGFPVFRRRVEEVPDRRFDPAFEFVGGGIGALGRVVDACNGDSGGPVYRGVGLDRTVIGITSRALVGDCGSGGIFTRLDAHRQWICDIARAVGSPIC